MAQQMELAGMTLRKLAVWLLAGAIWIGLLVLAGTLLPQRAKLLGLFAVGWGLAAGWGLGELARRVRLHAPRMASWLCVVLVVAGLTALHAVWYRAYAVELSDQSARLRDKLAENPTAGWKENLLQQDLPQATEEERQKHAEFLKLLERDERAHAAPIAKIDAQRTLKGYLTRRLVPFGDWSWPWPGVFWAGEVAVATVAAGWLVRRALGKPYCPICGHWETELRRISLRPREIREILGLWSLESLEPSDESTLVLSGCRCPERPPELQLLEGASQRATHKWQLGRPSAETWARIASLLEV